MYEILIYTKFTILQDTGPSITELVSKGLRYSQASHFVVWLGAVEVYRHINLEAY